MSLRLAALAFPLTLLATIVACQSSGPYGKAIHAGTATGLAVAAGAVNRASGGCWAQCRPGTFCDKASGLCVDREAKPAALTPPGKQPLSATASYPPGHEYSVPPADAADAGCAPSSSSGEGALSCEMDASAPH